MEDKISIIVPIYNSERYLDKCINSILNQTYKNLEIILIDDGSTDKSKMICEKYKKKDSRIIFISKKNTGVSDTRNIGLNIASGKYIGFVDSDDFIKLDMFEILIYNINKYRADLSICNIVEKNNRKYRVKELSSRDGLKIILENSGPKGYIYNKLYKKNIIDRYNIKFNVNIYMCEDLLFNCLYLQNIGKVIYTTQELYYYIKRRGSVTNSQYNFRFATILDAYNEMFKIYIKEERGMYDYFKAIYVLTNINLKIKMFLSNAKDTRVEIKCNKNIDKYIRQVLKSNYITLNIRLKVFCYYYFYDVIKYLKKILKQFKE